MSERSIEQDRIQPTTLAALDGYPLAGQVFLPASPPRAVVIINSATGTPARYYRRFAEYLTEADFAVITYDYRGIGASAPASLRQSSARMRDWGLLDFPGIIESAQKLFPARPILAVGHSVGGQILGLAPNNNAVRAMVFVCCQHTWWGHWPKSHWPRLHLLWRVLIPGLSHSMGYFPAAWLGMGEPLPKGVGIEWAQWARAKGYIPQVIGEHVRVGFDRYEGEILSLSFEDDHFAPRQAAAALLDFFPAAQREHRHTDPKQNGVPVGHFGFFRPPFRDTFWQDARYWLQARVGSG